MDEQCLGEATVLEYPSYYTTPEIESALSRILSCCNALWTCTCLIAPLIAVLALAGSLHYKAVVKLCARAVLCVR